jgi:hypothetical protein
MSTIGANVQFTPAAAASRPAARRRLGQLGIERPGLGERDRELQAVPVDHVEAEEQRDLESRLLDGALRVARVLGAEDVEKAAHESAAREVRLLRGRAPAGRQEIQLAEFFFEGHAGEERVEALRCGGRCRENSEERGEQRVARAQHGCGLLVTSL